MNTPYVSGIDISHYNGNINWAKVAASSVKFTGIKASDGLSDPDKMFVQNMAGAKGVGLLRMPYHFLRPYSDAVAQAQVFCKILGSDPGELPTMVDVEEAPVTGESDTWTRLTSQAARLAIVTNFINEVIRQLGRAPVLYSRASYFAQMFGNGSGLAQTGCAWWPAQYSTAGSTVSQIPDAPHIPAGWNQWTFWQYDGAGKCDGIAGQVDRDIFNGDLTALQAFAAATTSACT